MENKNVEILLVEDNPYEAKLTIASLKKYNLTNNLLHVDDGAEALDFTFCQGAYCDRVDMAYPKVILLDLNLPKIGGLEVLKQIKSNEKTKMIPIVILTSSKEDADVIAGYSNGVNSYIVKPVQFESFAKAIADLGMYWVFLNESSASSRMAPKVEHSRS